jgi:hypothetical protein
MGSQSYEQLYGRDYDQTYAGVCKSVTWKIIIAMAALQDWDIEQMDAVTAFLNSDIEGDVYMELPPGWGEVFGANVTNKVCKLRKGLYGLKQAPRLWQKKLSETLVRLGFRPLHTDNCVYIKTWPERISQVKKELMHAFQMEDMGAATYFLGVRIVRNRAERSITLIQDAYIEKILTKYGMQDAKPTSTPMQLGALNLMVTNPNQATKGDIEEYQSKMGSITYLAIQTRSDIAFECSVLSRFLTNPSQNHINAAKLVAKIYQRDTRTRCPIWRQSPSK